MCSLTGCEQELKHALSAIADDLMRESVISEFALVSATEVDLGSTGARLSKESGCAIARQAWQGMEHLMQHRRRGAPSTWSSQMLVVNETVLDGARPRRRRPTGWMRNSTAHPTSWFAVDGSERVGVSPRKTSDLRKIVIIPQITPT